MKENKVKVLAKYSPDGRITIPKEIRIALGLETVSEFEITVKDRDIVLEPVRRRCTICGRNLVGIEKHEIAPGIVLCYDCYKVFAKHFEGGK